jgi:DNA invertase Pin-like site-specific DNA recombinase
MSFSSCRACNTSMNVRSSSCYDASMIRFIAYFRVSTDRQGKSGLGLEGQRAAVLEHIRDGAALLAEYTEVETGKRDALDNRPELRKALAHARRSKAVLVVAKLDRLTRSVAVTSMLHQAHVEFVCCDNPHANRLTIQILAAVAEDEARRISDRTKAALVAYKARGGILGAARFSCRNLTPSARQRGAAASAVRRVLLKEEAYEDVMPHLRSLRSEGRSLRAIAAALNQEGHTTRRGRLWNPMQVARLLKAAAVPSSAMFGAA